MPKSNFLDGVPIVSAKKPLTLTITKADISHADTKQPSNCAAARACRRGFKATEARVHLGRIYIKEDGKWLRYVTPASLKSEIIAFDRGGTFEPGDYVLTPPAPPLARPRGAGKSKPEYDRNRKVKRRRPYHLTTGVRDHAAIQTTEAAT